MLEFIKENWKLLAECAAMLVIVVFSLIRKRSVSDICTYIYQFAKNAINIVEEESKKNPISSAEKLNIALELIKSMLKVRFPKLDLNSYNKVITDIVEEFLDTPQSHK